MSRLPEPLAIMLSDMNPLTEARFRAIVSGELRAALQETRGVSEATRASPESVRAPLLTARETAALLRVDERTLRRLVVEGDVPAPLRIGRRTIRWDAKNLYRVLGMQGPPT